MARNSGSKVTKCPICGDRYKVTNWMRFGSLRRPAPRLNDGRYAMTTHELACARKRDLLTPNPG